MKIILGNSTRSLFALSVLVGLLPLYANAIETRFETDAALPIVYLNVAVKAGAANDLLGKSGITNFVGEMMLRGTKTRTKAQIDEAIDQLGATLAVEVRSEAVIFRGRVLSAKLAEYMEILQEIITTPSFPEKEIKKLKAEVGSQILEARGKDNSLGKVMWEGFLFEGHPYGKPILGKTKETAALTRADLVRHYADLFQDRNLLVVGSGDSEASFVDAWAARLAEKRPNSAGENPVHISPLPKAFDHKRVRFIDKPDRTQTQVYFGQIGVRMTDPSFFPLFLANHVFGGGSFSARLMQEIRVKRGWSYGAYSYFRQGIRPRSWQAYTFPATKDTAAALALIDGMLRNYRESGITLEEFQFAQASLINSAGFAFNTPAKRVENILLEKTLDLPDGFMKTYASNFEKATLPTTNAAVKKFLAPDQLSILILGTAKDLKLKAAESLKVPESSIEVVPYLKE
ncbi:MAG: insulinase family protein [Cryobacterium sp.]|nr:insulinase family protein [Oligoflexia bacterium]